MLQTRGASVFPGEEALKQFLAQRRHGASRHGIRWVMAIRRCLTSRSSPSWRGKYGKSNAQIILRWHIQDGNIVIPASKNAEHIRDELRPV